MLKRGVIAGLIALAVLVLSISGCSKNEITGAAVIAPSSVVFDSGEKLCEYKLVDGNVIVDGVSLAKALGSSMRPTIQTGDTLLIKPYTSDTPLREGMIVSYTTDGQDQVHRIDGLYVNFFMAKGDNSETAEKVPYSAINGIVVGVLFKE